MNNGYVRIYRSLTEKGYYRESEYVHLWVHLIMKATYQNKEYLFNNKIEHLSPGQFITGRNSLVKETGINRSKIERILKCFENEHQIEQQTNNKFRIITIRNWSEYQQSEQQNEQPVSNQRATSEQPVSTNNKENKENKDNKEKNTYRKFVIPSQEEVAAYCKERHNNINPQTFIDHYTANGWLIGGKAKMKDWRATIRTWESRGGTNGTHIANAKHSPISTEADRIAAGINEEYRRKKAAEAADGGK
jgi:hypothetical protein